MFLSEELQRKYDSICHVGAERNVIGIAMNSPDALFDICLELEASDFSNFANKSIFEIMVSILDGKYANIGKVNPMIIAALAQQSGSLETIGGMQYIDILQRTDSGMENLDFFVSQVKQASIRRESFLKAVTVMNDAVECEEEDIDAFTSRQEEKFLDIILKSKGSDDIVHIGSIIDIVLDTREENPREVTGMPTGFAEYDRQTGGLVPAKLKVWAAVAKTGKSALALNVAINVAVREQIPVLYIDTEMPTVEQIDRMVSILATELSGITVSEAMVTKGLYVRNEKLKEAVEMARAVLRNSPFYHVYMPEFTPEKVHNLARKFQMQHGIEWNGYEKPQFLLIFDYIKMPDSDAKSGDSKEYQILGNITNMLKNKTATMLGIPVLAFAQLNPRTGHGQQDVNSSHMSGSNRIVMYANELAFLSKKTEEQMGQDGPENGNMYLTLGETRSGGSYKGWIDYTVRHGVPAMRELRNVSLTG